MIQSQISGMLRLGKRIQIEFTSGYRGEQHDVVLKEFSDWGILVEQTVQATKPNEHIFYPWSSIYRIREP